MKNNDFMEKAFNVFFSPPRALKPKAKPLHECQEIDISRLNKKKEGHNEK